MGITIKDIAKKAGVSITTVSKVINNKDESISDETRNRVKDIIKELNYQPNALARGLITKKTKTIALVLPDITNPFFPDVARGVEDYSNKHGYNVFLCNTDDNYKKENDYINLLKEKRVDGIIFSSANSGSDKTKFIHKIDIPLVAIDRAYNENECFGIFTDNLTGGYIAAKHLIDLNHKKIACITGPKEIRNSIERVNGYKKAIIEAGIELDESLIAYSDFKIDGGYKAGIELMKNKDITAIFACNDLMACGVYEAAYDMGLRIPDDISVVGFDDVQIIKALNPKLTTIKQPIYKIGQEAAKMLIKLIENKKINENIINLDVELVTRGSTRKL